MPDPAAPSTPPRRLRRWLLLVALSALFAGTLELARLPAAFLLGPMLAAILVAVSGPMLRVSSLPFSAAQAMIGCLVASSIDAGILGTIAADWLVFGSVTAATILVSAVIGYLLSRWHVLPGTAAVWGSSPGAAAAMVIMAQAYGADARLVAVMTYTRVVCVSLVAALLSFLIAGEATGFASSPSTDWNDPVHVAASLGVAFAGAVLGKLLRLPAGALLGPMLLGGALNIAGWLDPHPPQLLLALAYVAIGWRVGLNFTRETVKVAARALPGILAAMLFLIACCAGIGAALVLFADVDPLTAYLATSPGGMDSIAIIAASSNVDRPFVMALQALRFLAVLAAGPAVARFVAGRHLAAEKRRLGPPPA